GQGDRLAEPRQRLAEEQAGEDHRDEQPGQRRPDLHHPGAEQAALGEPVAADRRQPPAEQVGAQEQRAAAPDGRTGQVEPLRQLPLAPDQLRDQQQHPQKEECEADNVGGHLYLSVEVRLRSASSTGQAERDRSVPGPRPKMGGCAVAAPGHPNGTVTAGTPGGSPPCPPARTCASTESLPSVDYQWVTPGPRVGRHAGTRGFTGRPERPDSPAAPGDRGGTASPAWDFSQPSGHSWTPVSTRTRS